MNGYDLQVYEPDYTRWPPSDLRCRHGQGAGSVYGCVLERGHGRDVSHRYDDPMWETIAETQIIQSYVFECYRCNLESKVFSTESECDEALREHVRENHPEVYT